MIPRRYIEEWKEFAPWPEDSQVEQDLVIERALVSIFSDPYLFKHLAFRGGTALHKLFLKPQVRYSEDIDLVQINSEPIKETFSAFRKQMKFLGNPKIKQNTNNNKLYFRFDSEIPPIINLRLKIEINCREHFTVRGYKEISHKVVNTWAEGECNVKTYEVEEMLGTKLRAMFQRKKGRDLFDIYYALTNLDLDLDMIVYCYRKYMDFSVDKPPSQKQYIQNVEKKLDDPDFTGDIYALLRPGVEYNQTEAFHLIKSELLEKI